MSKRKGIYIPFHLAELLLAEKKDVKHPSEYEAMNKLAKSLLKVLVDAQKELK